LLTSFHKIDETVVNKFFLFRLVWVFGLVDFFLFACTPIKVCLLQMMGREGRDFNEGEGREGNGGEVV
jgi:hypothetical protein